MKSKKYQILNIITLILGIIITTFGISKIIYYACHRPLGVVDYSEIGNYCYCFISTVLLFVFATIYNKKKKLRVSTIVLYCITILIFILYSRYHIDKAIVMFNSDLWLPNKVDNFTFLFESISGSLFTLYLVITFIYLLVNKYFKGS